MMTIRKLPIAIPDTVGITPLDIDDRQIRIAKHASLYEWWRADTLLSISGREWLGRVAGRALTLSAGAGTVTATAAVVTALNNQMSFVMGSVSNSAGDPGIAGALPINGDYSVVSVSRPGPSGGFAPIWGNGLGTSGSYVQVTNTDSMVWNHNGGSVMSSVASVGRGTLLTIASFRYSATPSTSSAKLRVNMGWKSGASAVANNQNTNSTFRLGITGDYPVSGRLGDYGGARPEAMLFTAPILEAGYESLVADIEGYLSERYGVT